MLRWVITTSGQNNTRENECRATQHGGDRELKRMHQLSSFLVSYLVTNTRTMLCVSFAKKIK